MSGVSQIIQAFEGLGEGERETTLKALATMMRVESQPQPTKKKVNGFMGFRAYYSSLFTRLTQKERSPIMTLLWKEDPFHKEWDFMCAVYSAVREHLADQKVSLQMWIQSAVKPLGIVARDSYLETLGWQLVQLEDGAHTLARVANRSVHSYSQPMNALGLFMSCLNDGLAVANPVPIISKLSDLANDVICINTQFGDSTAEPATNIMKGFRQFAKTHQQLAMSALFQLPQSHPTIAQGVAVHHVGEGLPAPQTFLNSRDYIVPPEDAELEEMLNRIFRGEAEAPLGNGPRGMDPNYFTIDPLPTPNEPGFN